MQIKRNVINQLHDDLSTRTISILVGARQVGKTFLLRQIEKEAQKRGLKTAFFDLEQPEDLLTFSKSDRELVEFISGAGDVVFIDEFHYLKNSSRLFKAIYDKGHKIKIFASGSSAMEIHTHLKESLAGRKNIYGIYPCCLAEIGQVIQDNPFAYYCQYGGMPGLVNLPSKDKKQALLVDILQSYLLKDIKALIKDASGQLNFIREGRLARIPLVDLDVVVYGDGYLTDDGDTSTFAPFIADDVAFLVPAPADAGMQTFMGLSEDLKAPLVGPGRFSKSWEEEDPSGTNILVEEVSLPIAQIPTAIGYFADLTPA